VTAVAATRKRGVVSCGWTQCGVELGRFVTAEQWDPAPEAGPPFAAPTGKLQVSLALYPVYKRQPDDSFEEPVGAQRWRLKCADPVAALSWPSWFRWHHNRPSPDDGRKRSPEAPTYVDAFPARVKCHRCRQMNAVEKPSR
jgi:hypothetical protein